MAVGRNGREVSHRASGDHAGSRWSPTVSDQPLAVRNVLRRRSWGVFCLGLLGLLASAAALSPAMEGGGPADDASAAPSPLPTPPRWGSGQSAPPPPATPTPAPPVLVRELPPPRITAEMAVVIDEASGALLYSRDEAREVAPASLTKIVTAMV